MAPYVFENEKKNVSKTKSDDKHNRNVGNK